MISSEPIAHQHADLALPNATAVSPRITDFGTGPRKLCGSLTNTGRWGGLYAWMFVSFFVLAVGLIVLNRIIIPESQHAATFPGLLRVPCGLRVPLDVSLQPQLAHSGAAPDRPEVDHPCLDRGLAGGAPRPHRQTERRKPHNRIGRQSA